MSELVFVIHETRDKERQRIAQKYKGSRIVDVYSQPIEFLRDYLIDVTKKYEPPTEIGEQVRADKGNLPDLSGFDVENSDIVLAGGNFSMCHRLAYLSLAKELWKNNRHAKFYFPSDEIYVINEDQKDKKGTAHLQKNTIFGNDLPLLYKHAGLEGMSNPVSLKQFLKLGIPLEHLEDIVFTSYTHPLNIAELVKKPVRITTDIKHTWPNGFTYDLFTAKTGLPIKGDYTAEIEIT